jgi:hypothetical protein
VAYALVSDRLRLGPPWALLIIAFVSVVLARELRSRGRFTAMRWLAALLFESGSILAFQDVEGGEAGELLELLGVVIDGRGWHAAARGYSTCGSA